jgi:hypothetical protein
MALCGSILNSPRSSFRAALVLAKLADVAQIAVSPWFA